MFLIKSAMTLLGSFTSRFGFDARSFASVWWKFKNGFLLAAERLVERRVTRTGKPPKLFRFPGSGHQIFTSCSGVQQRCMYAVAMLVFPFSIVDEKRILRLS
jgi:hypothetical protein